MKKCSAIENLLPLYSEGILSDAEKRVVEEHLTACAACQKELARLQKAGRLVNHLSEVEEPVWFQQKIMARVREEADKQSFAHKWFYPLRIKIPVQIMATIVIAVLAVYIYRSGDDEARRILPGAPPPAVETQTQQAPVQMPQAPETALPSSEPREKAVSHEELKQDKQAPVRIAAGSVQKSEAPEIKANASYDAVASRAKGLSESKDEAKEAPPTKQYESARALPQTADQQKKAVEQTMPVTAKKSESEKVTAPGAPRVMGAAAEKQRSGALSVATAPEARVLMRVEDPNAAAVEVKKILARYHAANVTKQPSQGRMVIRAILPGKDWQNVLTGLEVIGVVKEKIMPADMSESSVNVVIEISGS